MWLPTFACACGEMVAGVFGTCLACTGCGARIEQDSHGVFRCLSPERRAQVEPFLNQYRLVRQRDGYRADRSDYYRALPFAAPDDPQRPIWRVRQRSFHHLRRALASRNRGPSPAVLDLGAGSGWLSYQLAKAGCRTVAVDLLADDRDGLGACRHYDVAFACVQADFDALPFAPRQFDAAVFNGSLHYARDTAATLARAAQMLRPGGMLVVADSPVFVQPSDGLAMQARQRERLRDQYGVAAPIQPGQGFLTFRDLAACAAALGRPARFFHSPDGWRQTLRRLGAPAIGRPRPAQFGVWVAA